MKKLFTMFLMLFCFSAMAQLVGTDIDQTIALGKEAAKSGTAVAWIDFIPWLLLLISEVLSYIPSVKANGVFQLIFGVLSSLTKKEAK